ncbi:hypothetical protein IPM19_04950 [bacterium]|nr:MAG: hypothetical protein IPM19_04950 [bacterium]
MKTFNFGLLRLIFVGAALFLGASQAAFAQSNISSAPSASRSFRMNAEMAPEVASKLRAPNADQVQLAQAAAVRVIEQYNRTEIEKRVSSAQAPMFAVFTEGNSFSGITAYACNSRDIPANSLVMGVSFLRGGPAQFKNVLYAVEPILAGWLCYPLDRGRTFVWTEEGDQLVTYQIYTIDASSTELLDMTQSVKDINRFTSELPAATKILSRTTFERAGPLSYIQLHGPINDSQSISVMLRDAETDFYPRLVPASAIKRLAGKWVVNLSMLPYSFGVNTEVLVLAAGDGRTGQQTVTMQ